MKGSSGLTLVGSFVLPELAPAKLTEFLFIYYEKSAPMASSSSSIFKLSSESASGESWSERREILGSTPF